MSPASGRSGWFERCRPNRRPGRYRSGSGRRCHARVVDEDVDRPKSFRNIIGQALHAFGVRNIELDRKRIVAHFSGELAKGFASRSTNTTLRPLSSSALIMARPMPPAAPVTTAFRSDVQPLDSPLRIDKFALMDGPASIDRQRRARDVLCGLA